MSVTYYVCIYVCAYMCTCMYVSAIIDITYYFNRIHTASTPPPNTNNPSDESFLNFHLSYVCTSLIISYDAHL